MLKGLFIRGNLLLKEKVGNQLKKLLSIIALLSIVSGCSYEKSEEEQNVMYFGVGEDWFGTYTISKVHSSFFESLYIQRIIDRENEPTLIGDVGEIEYVLDAGSSKLKSNSPQPLKGIGNFHTATETSGFLVEGKYPEQATLTIEWNNQTEEIILTKQN